MVEISLNKIDIEPNEKLFREKKTDQPMKKLFRINSSWYIRGFTTRKKENKRTLMRDHKLLSKFSILEDTRKFSLLENTRWTVPD